MKKRLILAPVLLALAAFLAVVASKPDTFRIARSVTINAPASAIFPYVNNLRRFNDWSPWAQLDPQALTTFEGPEAGEGAGMYWSGNEKVGEGRMTETISHPPDLVQYRLAFLKPMKATHIAEFTLFPAGATQRQTLVTWAMTGKHDFWGKAISLVMNCDKMVGTEFEKGLATLKAKVEATPPSKPVSPNA
jgi:Polyketide cyclase / dehydrase and lipid transport